MKFWHRDVLNGKGGTLLNADVTLVSGENTLTAYAFNNDDIKSEDALLSVTGAEALARKGTAYILSVGINDYANDDFKLKYAVPDAIDFVQEIKSQQERLATYDRHFVVSLADATATRANFLYALRRLAGKETGPLPAEVPAQLAQLRPAQPEDTIFIYFAGHGKAAGDAFYMVPFDLGYGGTRADLNATAMKIITSHSVSNIDLEEALKRSMLARSFS